MRFYDPNTTPPERLDSEELFPKLDPTEAALKCVKIGLLPSVTNVLGVIRQEYLEKWKMFEAIKNFKQCGNAWQAVEEHYKKDSKESIFGTEVHEAIHDYVTTKKTTNTEAGKHALPAIQWIENNVKDILYTEETLACKKTGAAGTIDLAFVTKNDKLVIGDLKVVKIKKKFPPNPSLAYRCQLSAYAEMLKVKTGNEYERLSLYLASPFGDEPAPKLMIFPYKKDYLGEFKACLDLWHAQYGNGFETVSNCLPQETIKEFDIDLYKTK